MLFKLLFASMEWIEHKCMKFSKLKYSQIFTFIMDRMMNVGRAGQGGGKGEIEILSSPGSNLDIMQETVLLLYSEILAD